LASGAEGKDQANLNATNKKGTISPVPFFMCIIQVSKQGFSNGVVILGATASSSPADFLIVAICT